MLDLTNLDNIINFEDHHNNESVNDIPTIEEYKAHIDILSCIEEKLDGLSLGAIATIVSMLLEDVSKTAGINTIDYASTILDCMKFVNDVMPMFDDEEENK